MSFGIALPGVPKGIWFLDANFISAHCKTFYKTNHPGKKVPLWFSEVFKWNLRGVQHGPNACMRNPRGKVVPVIGWEIQLPTSEESKVQKLVNRQASFMCACFAKTDKYSIGSLALDHIEEHSNGDPINPGVKAGLYKTITKNVADTTGVEARLTREINLYFAKNKFFECGAHWDKFFTDADIKPNNFSRKTLEPTIGIWFPGMLTRYATRIISPCKPYHHGTKLRGRDINSFTEWMVQRSLLSDVILDVA